MSNRDLRILIVEDNDIYRELFKNSLQRSFPELAIDEATDGLGALYKVNAFSPDLIFMDIHLREENGIELAKQIKTMHPRIHVVILTFYDMPEYREAALKCGTDGFLAKASLSPTDIEKMVKSYQRSLEKGVEN